MNLHRILRLALDNAGLAEVAIAGGPPAGETDITRAWLEELVDGLPRARGIDPASIDVDALKAAWIAASLAEQQAEAAATAVVADVTAAKADLDASTVYQQFKTATKDQVDAFVDARADTLAGVRSLLKIIFRILWVLVRRGSV
jgi:hypothetical protein